MAESQRALLLVLDCEQTEIQAAHYQEIAERIAAQTTMTVYRCTANGPQGIRGMLGVAINSGATEVIVAPLLFGETHPALVTIAGVIRWARSHWPFAAISRLPPYANAQGLATLLLRRLSTTLDQHNLPRENLTVVVAGPEGATVDTNAEVSSAARRFWERSQVRWVEVACRGGASPDLGTVLARCRRAGDEQIVIMPVELFHTSNYALLQQHVAALKGALAPPPPLLAMPLATVEGVAATMVHRIKGDGMFQHSHPHGPDLEPQALLPPRYQGGAAVSAAPMGAADLRFDADGQVAWDEIWGDFCDLALAGGPPHRGTLLEPVMPEQVAADPAGYARVVEELARGLRLVTGLPVVTDAAPGWIGLACADEAMALWLLRAIVVENITVRREGAVLFLPAGPDFRLEREIKNVITVAAKTNHYWKEHRAALQDLRIKPASAV
ncbi:MAG TPA: CbiX/SirB N-terminal domain-containing protein [Roseiflexaceae bacterium]|nr:CbiX/SirB N-terminal domain-containing protein [Roseiflexaceae bacterium]